jgi:hypothetical protein
MGRVYFYIKKGILLTFKKKKNRRRNGIMLYQKREEKKKTRRKLYHLGFQKTKRVTLQPRRVYIN